MKMKFASDIHIRILDCIHDFLPTGSWNASFSPKLNLAVGKSESDSTATTGTTPINDLTYHHSFALFQIYAAIINIPICIFWAGGLERVGAILAHTPASSIVLVVLFSVIWGIGVS